MTRIGKTFNQIACMECGHTAPATLAPVACPACGSAWIEARYDYEQVAKRWPRALRSRDKDLWRYAELLPLDLRDRVTMSEGWSPLLHAERLGAELGHPNLYIKDERQSPTSSFKDRQAALAVSALKAAGISEVAVASTGNAAVAYAAYCARAGIRLWIFVTSKVPVEKIREAALYGAEVIKVAGTYDQAKEVAAQFAARHHLTLERGVKGVVGKESMKTIAFEIAEQLGWQAPDWYIQAVSGGIGPVGVWKGFTELHRMGLIDRLPRMGIVQVEGCSPMVRAFQADKDKADPVEPRTIITILATGDPGFAYTLLYRAAKEHGGAMVAVSDEDAFAAMRKLARTEGFSVEPATAVAFAGLEKLIAGGIVRPDQRVVINASGHTMPVEKFILGEQPAVDIEVSSPLAAQWDRAEGLTAALENLDEKVTSIVIIDDSPQDSRLIRRLLHTYKSYRVFEAHDGKSGLDLIRERHPDLIILDLMMPEMDGFDVLGRLKADPALRGIPVMVVSAKHLTAEEKQQLASQTISVWTKGSYQTADLVGYIARQLGDTPPVLAHEKTPSPAPARSAAAQDARRTILIVDDNPLDGRLIQRTLAGHDSWQLSQAASGEQALRLLDDQTPDAIILDLILPDMTGLEVLERLRERPQLADVPVLVLTAKDLTQAEQEALADRAELTLIKGSIDRAALARHVQRVVEEAKTV